MLLQRYRMPYSSTSVILISSDKHPTFRHRRGFDYSIVEEHVYPSYIFMVLSLRILDSMTTAIAMTKSGNVRNLVIAGVIE